MKRRGSPRIRALVWRLLAERRFRLVNGPLALDLLSRQMTLGASPLHLGERERSVLLILMAKTGKTIPKQRLANILCVGDEQVSPNAIEEHIARLRKKLAPAGIVIRTARGLGYALERFQLQQTPPGSPALSSSSSLPTFVCAGTIER